MAFVAQAARLVRTQARPAAASPPGPFCCGPQRLARPAATRSA